MHNMLFDKFGSLRIIELLELKQGIRNYCRWVIPVQEERRYERIISLTQINYTKSDFFLSPIQNKSNDDNYFHEYMRSTTRNNNDRAYRVIYLSNKNPNALKLSEGDHNSMGRLLGYPDCCIKSFIEYHSTANPSRLLNNNALKLHEKLFMKNEFLAHPFYLNLLKRDEGLSMLSHLPCSTECKKTHQIAMKRSILIENHDVDLYDSLKNSLMGEYELRGKKLLFY